MLPTASTPLEALLRALRVFAFHPAPPHATLLVPIDFTHVDRHR